MPTDEALADTLLDSIKDGFDRTLPRCVLEDLMDEKDSRVMNLWTGSVTTYQQYLQMSRPKPKTNATGTLIESLDLSSFLVKNAGKLTD